MKELSRCPSTYFPLHVEKKELRLWKRIQKITLYASIFRLSITLYVNVSRMIQSLSIMSHSKTCLQIWWKNLSTVSFWDTTAACLTYDVFCSKSKCFNVFFCPSFTFFFFFVGFFHIFNGESVHSSTQGGNVEVHQYTSYVWHFLWYECALYNMLLIVKYVCSA